MDRPYEWRSTYTSQSPTTPLAAAASDVLDLAIEHGAAAECAKHGLQRVTDVHTWTGFAGGSCWAADLACGCTLADESDDLRAAR
jgi:hypothetical protein